MIVREHGMVAVVIDDLDRLCIDCAVIHDRIDPIARLGIAINRHVEVIRFVLDRVCSRQIDLAGHKLHQADLNQPFSC